LSSPEFAPEEESIVDPDIRFMRLALQEARMAFDAGEVPVGAVIADRSGRVLGRGHNQVETLQDPTAHAEIMAIGAAANALESWRLEGAVLYSTLEPCHMCAGAIVLSRLDRLVFGAYDPKAGACGSLRNVVQDERLNHQVPVTPLVLAEECGAMLKEFFRELRRRREAAARWLEENKN
jgi:tRNA(adenine34) deaminase